MAKCEWCNAEGETRAFQDSFGESYYICEDCYKAAKEGICRKCKTKSKILIKGYCETCIQGINYEQEKAEEEERMGVGLDSIEYAKGVVKLEGKVWEQCLLSSKSVSPEDFKRSRQLRFIWALVKFRAVGIKDEKLINEKFEAVEKMTSRSFDKLVGVHCTMIIANTDELRQWAEEQDIIDKEDDVYILRGF